MGNSLDEMFQECYCLLSFSCFHCLLYRYVYLDYYQYVVLSLLWLNSTLLGHLAPVQNELSMCEVGYETHHSLTLHGNPHHVPCVYWLMQIYKGLTWSGSRGSDKIWARLHFCYRAVDLIRFKTWTPKKSAPYT